MRSRASAQRLQIRWKDLFHSEGLGQKKEEEFFTTLREVKGETDKGNLVFLYLYNGKDKKKLDVFEDTLFADEEIALGAKLFSCFKFNLGASPKVYQDQIKDSPRFLFIGTDGKVWNDVSLKGYKAKASTVFRAMTKAVNHHSRFDMNKFTKEERKLLAEFDKVNEKKTKVLEKLSKARIKTKGKENSEIRKLKKEEEELTKEETLIKEKEKKLLAKLDLKIDLETK